MRISKVVCLVVVFCAAMLFQAESAQAQRIPLWGAGTGVYHPNAEGTGGVYDGHGVSTVLWFFGFDGSVQITGADPSGLNLVWQNPGNGSGPPDEQFHICRTYFGQLEMRIRGDTELMPCADGSFRARWTGRFEIVSGTGWFRRARGYADVVANNPPFQLTDPDWPFTWYWNGRISLW